MKSTDPVSKVYKICQLIKKLDEGDIAELKIIAGKQKHFVHPLKGAKQTDLNQTGDYNSRLIESILAVQAVLETAKHK